MELRKIPEGCLVSLSWRTATSKSQNAVLEDSWISIAMLEHALNAFIGHLLCALFYCALYLLFTTREKLFLPGILQIKGEIGTMSRNI